MNKRIEELKHQARVWCDENCPGQFSEETGGYGTVWENRFAELIIAECVSTIESRAVEKPMSDYYIKQIKEHLGVE